MSVLSLWPGGPDSGGLLGRQELVVDGRHLEVGQSDRDGSRLFAGPVAVRSKLRLELHREPFGELLEFDSQEGATVEEELLAVRRDEAKAAIRLQARNRALHQ